MTKNLVIFYLSKETYISKQRQVFKLRINALIIKLFLIKIYNSPIDRIFGVDGYF